MLMFDEFYDREHEYKALIDYQKITRKKIRGVCFTLITFPKCA